jgi:hypothetical protein
MHVITLGGFDLPDVLIVVGDAVVYHAVIVKR